MSWENNPQFSVDEAQQRGVDVYEVLVNNWSRNDVGEKNLQWPPAGQQAVSLSLAGIAIGPRSTIDRCWVSYNLQKHQLSTDVATTDRMRRLSVDSPLIYTQAALRGTTPDLASDTPYQAQAETGPLIVTAYAGTFNTPANYAGKQYPGGLLEYGPVDSTVMPASYVDVNGASRTFIVESSPPQPGALFPLLHLLLYLKAPPSFVPLKRFPLVLRGDVSVIGDDVIIAQIPIYGRKRIKLMIIGSAGVTYNFRIGAIRALADYSPIYEEPVDSVTGVPGGTPVVLSSCAGQDLNADYLNIYATGSGGAVGAHYQLTAYD
jgi:hypothetical protein